MNKLVVRIAGLTDQGLVRNNNEDALWIDADAGLLIVADGMGGHPSGEKASAIAVRTIPESLAKSEWDSAAVSAVADEAEGVSETTRRLAAAMAHANRMIFDQGQKSATDQGMGTTCTAVLIRNDWLSLAHVGDTRCYLVRRGEIRQLSHDHSVAMEQVRQGVLSVEEARHIPQNFLTRALGTENDVQIDMDECRVQAGDVVIVCSDGLDKEVSTDQIQEVTTNSSDPESLARHLLEMAIEGGGSDNVTIAVAMITSPGFLGSVLSRFTPRS